MAHYQSHVSFSIFLGLAYALLGMAFFNVAPEQLLLASVVVIIAGILPDVDASGGVPEREVGSLLAAVAPIFLIEFYPGLKSGGVSRLALVVICSYILTRLVVVRGLQKFTIHRGMVHSIPAAIITFELVYLMFWDLHWEDRIYIAAGAFIGFLSHLMMDGYSNLDLLGKAMGKSEKKPAALKVLANSWFSTCAMYGIVLFLGWFVARDLNPHLRLVAGIQY